ncbi:MULTISPECIES: formate dehydrogenase accessory sulfurtransferase FdhD [Acetobacter]|uniref:formate dehydrogenase accessory sulfurtransferase FdhD n=1 Tax=Acetobacter TaxID=434 RepID=UPI000A3BAD52|nr:MULTISPECIES: formate dehydrogenase accessory sulfurtransferase FdhD [Acetobacter]MBS0985471.1 formate dehydrogenase accessory sulfurtransferase FdhD [Acetobacter thailandicus]OUJ10273.1 formate dehydrogenase [Acetobacter sp. DsW_059]
MISKSLIFSWDTKKITGHGVSEHSLKLADETPVTFIINSISYATMMITAENIEDYSYGFLKTERLVSSPDHIRSLTIDTTENGITVNVLIKGSDFKKILQSQRNMTGRTGCGVCGTQDLETLHTNLPSVAQKPPVTQAALLKALNELPHLQILNKAVHMVHGAARCSVNGDILAVREDIGRHNALDKLIGDGLRNNIDFSEGFCLITSRCSYEMAQKAIIAGFTTLVAISAPTVRALHLAQQAGLTLIGLARPESQFIFTQPEATHPPA